MTPPPKHVAIIMDGNGRWAKTRGYPRFYGHIRGSSRVREIVREAKNIGIKALTLYAFSTENWKRPGEELSILWRLLQKYVRREVKELKQNGVCLRVIGDLSRLPIDARKELLHAVQELKDGKNLTLTFALSYGGRQEMIDAIKKISQKVLTQEISVEAIDEQLVSENLATAFLGAEADVDFLIRTSGEKRISNFLLWQSAYAEFDFPEVYWPDYSVEHFRRSLETFNQRNRRFGGL